jgi:methionyl-tRNA formyltransferase
MPNSRIVFMGTPSFSVPCLDTLCHSSGFEVVAVVTQPDRPAGRGKQFTPSPVKVFATEKGIPVFTPERLRQDDALIDAIAALAPDFIVTIAFGQILPTRVLEIPKGGVVNVHASLLPAYRGANPIQWAILDGQSETGLTTMLSDEGVDTGAMLLKQVLPIEAEDTTGSLSIKLAEVAGGLLLDTLNALKEGRLTPELQNDSLATQAPKLKKESLAVDWSRSAHQVKQYIQALTPAPGAKVYLKRGDTTEDAPIKIGKISVLENSTEVHETTQGLVFGQIVALDHAGIHVQTGDGHLCIETLQPAGKGMMKASDWGRNRLSLTGDSTERVCFV